MNNDKTALNSALQEFFVTSLQEMYWSEVNLANMLQTMSESASSAKKNIEIHKIQVSPMHDRKNRPPIMRMA